MRSSFYRGRIILIQLFLIAGFPAVKDVYAQTFIVKQNGTGDYSIIQDAVDVAQIGDTVLVYPGTYYENIDLTDKGIVLASTWLLNHQDSLIQSTIIDGNQNGSCIKSESGEHLSEIIGFTIQHGNGTNYLESMYPYLYGSGGGVYASESNLVISHCNIVNNFGRHGGGLLAGNSSVLLSNNTFTGNWAVGQGGGIMTYSSKVIYDSIYLNNVYLNFSSAGSDIAIFYNDTISTIWLDTCTVQNPDQYYIGKFSDWAIHIERPPVSVLHGKIEQANQDLFVSTSGNDTNSGFTPDEPLKTISYALVKIASDSMDMKTIHVANGIYSNTLTGEHIPLQLKNWVNLKGDSRENTIIDCEGKYEGARFAFGQDFTHLKNMTFLEGNGFPIMLNGGLSSGYSQKLILDSISFVGTTGDVWAAIYSDSDDSLIVKNSIFKDCSSHYAVNCHVKNYDNPRYNEFVSCIFAYNHVDTAVIPEWEGRHVSLGLSGSEFDFGWNKTLILNCLFNDNLDSFVWNGSGGAAAISTYEGCQVEIINSTFANNLTINNPSGGAVGASGNSTVNFTNSILYDNYACQAYLSNDNENRADTMIINNTLVQNGLEGIRDYGSFNHMVWAENNLDADPIFIGSENYPYAIDFDSPCIDAGTLNLPPGIELPEYDLAGNPRIWGESVDMGAYEYGPWVSVPSAPNSKFQIPNSKLFYVNPNPFSYGTYISYELIISGKLNISVYSISGMKVRTLENHQASKGDTGKFYWNGSDQQGNDLPAGVYLIRMTIDGKEVETMKAVKGER